MEADTNIANKTIGGDVNVEERPMAQELIDSSMPNEWTKSGDDGTADIADDGALSSSSILYSPAVWSVPTSICELPINDQASGRSLWPMTNAAQAITSLPSSSTWSNSVSSYVHTAPPISVVSTEATGSIHCDSLNIDTKDDFQSQHDQSLDLDYSVGGSSPDENMDDNIQYSATSRFYKCRFCNFSALTYTQLQLHMPKHGGVKALKCPLCDYSTNDKSNFRRHRRLHQRNNPVSVLKCGKCSYSTILPKKIREHYSQQHNEHYVPTVGESSSYLSPAYNGSLYGIRQIEVGHNQCSSANGNISSNALHSLIGSMHSSALNYGQTTRQPVTNCLGPYSTFHNPSGRRHSEEGHMASNYLRSIVSSIMNTNHSPRHPATSTITSSSHFFATAGSSDRLSPDDSPTFSEHCQMPRYEDKEVRVKMEPVDFDGVSDVSSSASPHSNPTPETTYEKEVKSLYQNRIHNGNYISVVDGSDKAISSSDANLANSNQSSCSKRDICPCSETLSVKRTVKIEKVSVGVQCSLPAIKLEDMPVLDDKCGEHIKEAAVPVDRSIQCELLATCLSRRSGYCTQSIASESDISEQQSLMCGETRCCHCGVTFDDEVLFSIHIGCHSHTDPFVCNVCGKQCGNKYGFYSHIMRGHQF